jgi:3'(2'), 5'-bisphosphate nucleotidase
LEPVTALARHAADAITAIYNRTGGIEVRDKEDRSPLTEADMAAHHAIVAGLDALTPDLPVLSEESAEIPFSERSLWERYWLVDPLDGTREFLKRNGEFTVNIALIERHQPILGVILAPVTGLCYFACRGQGAYKQVAPHTEPTPIRVRARRARRVTVAISRSHPNAGLEQFLKGLGDYECVAMGSSLKSCMVAEGAADIYVRLGPTSEWDTAAAQCIVEEAGGAVTDTTRQTLRYNTKKGLLNPHFLVFGDLTHPWEQYLPAP